MLWIGSGRFDGRIGDGNGPRACGVPDVCVMPTTSCVIMRMQIRMPADCVLTIHALADENDRRECVHMTRILWNARQWS